MWLPDGVEEAAVLLHLLDGTERRQRRQVGDGERVDARGLLAALCREPLACGGELLVAEDATGDGLALDPRHDEAGTECVVRVQDEGGARDRDTTGLGRTHQLELGGACRRADRVIGVAAQDELVASPARVDGVERPGLARCAAREASNVLDGDGTVEPTRHRGRE